MVGYEARGAATPAMPQLVPQAILGAELGLPRRAGSRERKNHVGSERGNPGQLPGGSGGGERACAGGCLGSLVRRADGRGRVAAFETLSAVSAVRNSIRERKTHQIASVIQTGVQHGMMTLDQSLAHLARSGIVTFEEAHSKAKDTREFTQLVMGDQAAPAETA